MIFDTRVNGVPCQCKVLRFDACGFPEDRTGIDFDFKLLDRNGRHAPWLERHLSPEISQQLCDDYQIMFLAEQHQSD
jgi:hypothetical protein